MIATLDWQFQHRCKIVRRTARGNEHHMAEWLEQSLNRITIIHSREMQRNLRDTSRGSSVSWFNESRLRDFTGYRRIVNVRGVFPDAQGVFPDVRSQRSLATEEERSHILECA